MCKSYCMRILGLSVSIMFCDQEFSYTVDDDTIKLLSHRLPTDAVLVNKHLLVVKWHGNFVDHNLVKGLGSRR